MNGDGYDDVIVGSAFYDNGGENLEGAAFLLLGSAMGIAEGIRRLRRHDLKSNQETAVPGPSVAGAGDVNADGYDDVLIGSRRCSAGQTYEGAAFVFWTRPAFQIAPATADAQIESNQAEANLGFQRVGLRRREWRRL
ncbi:MAG: FG-GAP repeat protein [Deltaproteobacteria bacterium]|nr:FG-GAP repeat protein [Deltaproteobacteria bacterium]